MGWFLVWLWGESRVESAVSGKRRSSRRRRRCARFWNIDRTKEASTEFKKCMCFSLVQSGPVWVNCTCDSMGLIIRCVWEHKIEGRGIERRRNKKERKKEKKKHFSDGFGRYEYNVLDWWGFNYVGFYRSAFTKKEEKL